MSAVEATWATVYLLYDDEDRLLYVGVTGRDLRRFDEHARTAEWWPLVARAELEHLPTRARALWREAWLIRNREPLFNVRGREGRMPERVSSAALESPRVVTRAEFREAVAAKVRREFGGMGLDELRAAIRRGEIARDDARLREIAVEVGGDWIAPSRPLCQHCEERPRYSRSGLCKRCSDYKRKYGRLPDEQTLDLSARRR